jgi:glycosyltransferase involved in cell wall biosynthesis
MKVLYCGHTLQNTGWGRAIRDNILALDAAGADVVWRPVRLDGDNYKPEGRILELLEKDISGADYVIQHVLPQYLSYNSNFKRNISYFVAETLGWENYSGFKHNINIMDEMWCPNTEMANNSDGIKIPKRVVPHPCNPAKYQKEYKKFAEVPELNSGYNFYCIAEWNKRKRLGAIIQAFNLEFKRTEPVNLVIKTYKAGIHPNQLGNEIQNLCQEIKAATKLYKDKSLYPNELIISSFMPEDEIMGLHETCQCFINASYGESWSYPTFDAMATGNCILTPFMGGPKDFLVDYDNWYYIYYTTKAVFGMHKENFSNYNSSRETWCEVDIEDLRYQMRQAYNHQFGVKKHRECGLKIANEYSYETVGKKMMELLDV